MTAVIRASTITDAGTPRRRIATSVGKLTGAPARSARNQMLKKEMMINPTMSRTSPSMEATATCHSSSCAKYSEFAFIVF